MVILGKYFQNLSSVQQSRFARLEPLYKEWNEKINVVSRKDIDNLYMHHVLHSLAIAKYIRFNPGTYILDVGTGGGFPGIPLAILFPKTSFLLIDSIGKKIKVVQAVAESLKLKNCRFGHQRVQDISGKFDFIVARAVTTVPEFVGLTKGRIRKDSVQNDQKGLILLKGGDLADELNISFPVRIVNISEYFDEPYFQQKKIVHILMS